MAPPLPSDYDGPALEYQPIPTTNGPRDTPSAGGPPGYVERTSNCNAHDLPPPPPPPPETDELPGYGEALGTRLITSPILQRSRTAPTGRSLNARGSLSAAQEKAHLQSQLEADEEIALNIQHKEEQHQIMEDVGLAHAARS